ncbi:MAG TPA: MG2 domain-containing protein [Bacteroidales bacterium]|nr:MG2 domain-containing protein [Bacteroidales bacterium]
MVFRLDKLYPAKKQNNRFAFSFNTFPLNIDVEFEGLKTYTSSELTLNHIDGRIRATDKISPPDIEQIVVATQGDRILPVSWDHADDGTLHAFTIDSVLREDAGEKVVISWDGSPAGIDAKGSREYEVPSLGSFVLMDHKIVQQPQQYILLRFSDPILSSQSLEGLISLSNNTSLKFSVNDNEVKAYPAVRQYGTVKLDISPGIRNVSGYGYDVEQSLSLSFEELKPGVRLIGEGVIIPESGGLLFPFEAVNLKAVDVKIVKIFEDNIAQFLQVNSLKGDHELKRAGRLLIKKTVDLVPERPINFGEWNAFTLDLSKLIKTDPGAIYRVELSFRKKYSLYQCPGEDTESEDLTSTNRDFETINENDLAYWDATTNYDPYYSSYNWNERNDPCSDSYYTFYGRKVARNVLASNLGIIAKQGEDGSMLFAVTDLRTTQPLDNVKLDIYNYQHQLLGSLTTNNQGTATTTLDSQPWLLIARKDKQRGYLRIDQRSAISLSQFDVSGSHTEKGVKGFIYGERGVWRPGDTIHLAFIMEDKSNQIPDEHPVVFELTDPMGKLRKKITRTSGLNGLYYFPVATSPDDPTGSWKAKISIGGLRFYKSLRIETVKPNRLKLHLDFGEDMIFSGEEPVKGKLSVTWLHGAPAGNMKTRVDVNYTTRHTVFEDHPGYIFNDIAKSFNPVEKVIFEGKTDAEGKTTFEPSLDVGHQAPGMLNAIFTTRVFEQGGDFSIDRFSVPYSPYPAYVGLKAPEGDRYGMLQTDTLQEFKIISLDQKGNPVKRKNLEVRVYKLNWRWWWHSSNENLASFSGNSSHETVYKATLNTGSDGKGVFNVKIGYPEWGRFLIMVKDPTGGHSVSQIVYFDWPGYAGRASRNDPQAASILPFSSDKTKYNTGETAKISIPASMSGRILLTIESGTKVLDYYWLEANGQETTFSFTVTPEMAPNVYVNVSLIQPHAQTKNDLPIRMYGVIPLLVEDPETHLFPELEMPGVLRPESGTTIKVSEKNGRAMTYTIAMVDEGLLDLTRFNTPDPWHTFYAKEALGVKTFDLYNLVLGAYGGRIDGVFSIGGGEDENGGNPQKRANRFPPVVKFLGPYYLKAGRENEHQVQIPNYTGSVRTMIVAANNGAYGSADKTTPVRKPLMVITSLPRVLAPGEKVSLPVTVFALENNIKDVDISIEANDLFETGETSRKVHFDAIGEQTFNFGITVKEKTGIGKVSAKVASGNESAHYDTELDIRSPNPEITNFVYGVIDPDSSWDKTFSLPGMQSTNKGILEVSSIPPMDFGRRLKYLLRYPHGCVEQVTSAAFPQLFLKNVIDVSSWNSDITTRNVKAAIEKLGKFVLPSGGFGYWPGSTIENEWGSSYAGHFLLEAREQGYDVPEAWLSGWRRYQRKTARNWRSSGYSYEWQKDQNELIQAYRLYTLALAGAPETGAMNRLRETPGLYHIAKWRLAAAYVLAGQKEQAEEMVRAVTTDVDPVYHTEYTFGSGLRDKAMILETMNLLGQREQAVPLIQYISDQLSSGSWYSTQTTAYALMAVSEFLGKDKMSREVNYDFHFDHEKTQHAAAVNPVSEIHKTFDGTADESVQVTNTGKGTLFVRLMLSGTPLAGKEEAKSSNLSLSIDYRSMDGTPLNIDRLSQGTDFVVVVSVYNPGSTGRYSNLALTQIFPSGWEIQNMRLFGSTLGDYDKPDYQDIRDDRVYSYFDLAQRKTKRFVFKLTATYKGRFYLPGVSCNAMYNNDITAVVPGKWIEVVAPGE